MTTGSAATGESNLAGRLLSATCEIFGVTEDDIRSERRAGISEARWALAYILSSRAGWNFSRIGRFLNKNHAAARYGCWKAETLMRRDAAFLEAVEMLEAKI